jgi:hypothetical protein
MNQRKQTRAGQRGNALVVFVLGLTVVGILITGSLRWRRGQAQAAVDAWAWAAAAALAQGGVEAARAALVAGQPVVEQPLGGSIELGHGVGTLEVSLIAQAKQPLTTACATVTPRSGRAARVCLQAVLLGDGRVVGLSRVER